MNQEVETNPVETLGSSSSSSSIGNNKFLANIEERTGLQPVTAFIGDFFVRHSWSSSLRHCDPVLYVVELEEYLEITTAPIMHAVNSKTSIVQYPYNETILENVRFSRIQAKTLIWNFLCE